MNLDSLKQTWREDRQQWQAAHLDLVWSHPALRSLRRQLAVETACWALLVTLYYTALDGALRPLAWNVALVVGLAALIGHGLLGYRLAGRPVGDAPLRVALTRQLADLRRYSRWSIALRTLVLLLFFGFLLSTVAELGAFSWTWRVATVVVWTGLAAFIQSRLWRGYLRRLERTLAELVR